MGQYRIHIFLTHCFIPNLIQVGKYFHIIPFEGVGISDVADLIDNYMENIILQPPQPEEHKIAMSKRIRALGATAVVIIDKIKADSPSEAIRATEEMLIICRDILALNQLQRGTISGFIAEQTDVSPVQLSSQIRPPFAILRKVQNIPMYETESDIFTRLLEKAKKYPLLKMYLSLYAETVSYTDTLVSDVNLETRLLKTWTLLEAMAFSEKGKYKKEKVRALFNRYNTSTSPNYLGHKDRDLLDVAYDWRNIVVHCGGCKMAIDPKEILFCETFQANFGNILEELNQICRTLIYVYANSLQ